MITYRYSFNDPIICVILIKTLYFSKFFGPINPKTLSTSKKKKKWIKNDPDTKNNE